MVAVFGNVTTEMRQHSVTLSSIKQWNENPSALPDISRVFVLCGNDTIPYIEKVVNRGTMTFVSEQPFKGETGKTYKLVVKTPTSDITAEDYLLPLGDTDYFQLMKENVKCRVSQTPSGRTKYDFQFPKHIYTLAEHPPFAASHFIPKRIARLTASISGLLSIPTCRFKLCSPCNLSSTTMIWPI